MSMALGLPILLRIAGALVFPVAVALAAILNRSVWIVPLMAGAATLTQAAMAQLAPNPLNSLSAMVSGSPPQNIWKKALRGFIAGTVGYGVVFSLVVLVAAVFQETELQPMVRQSDLILVALATATAAGLALINARTTARQMAQVMAQFGAAGTPDPGDPETADGIIIEGEIIEDAPKP
ncbi:MAG: hypothetical protein AAGF20_12490 [Pseudomonadota bacterium]